jgi:AIPR protein
LTELDQFHDELMADVIADAAAAGSGEHADAVFKENAFTRIIAADLEAAGVLEAPTVCYYADTSGRLPYKVNAYSLPEEEQRLDIVVADFRPEGAVQKLTAADVDRSFKQTLRFLNVAVEQGARGVDPGHEEHSMLRDIFAKRLQFDRAQLILITNAQLVQRREKERREELGGYQIGYEVWDLERLRRFRSSGATHEPVEVDLTGLPGGGIRCVPVSDDALGYQTCVAMIPGQVLYELYEEHGARLLELNVRSYLQARGKINKEILETLMLKPQLFLAYNNGITIVAEKIQLDKTGTLITGIHGLQIVNGGQTTASIHRARKDSKADLTHVFVQAKLTVVPSEKFDEMVPEISRLSNTQNKVSTVDLGANHAFHIGVERVARKTWAPGEQSMWFYERARGAFQTERSRAGTTDAKRAAFDRKFPASQRITKEDLARYSNTWNGFPHVVSRGGQKNFERFMNGLKKVDKGWEPTRTEFRTLVGRAILFLKTQQLAKSLGIKAFGINIVTYTVALLADHTARRIDLGAIWDRQDLSPALKGQARDWLPKVASELLSSAGERNPGEWFKSEQCWQELRSASTNWPISTHLTAELSSVGEEYAHVSDDVQSNVARCLQADAQKWFRIQLWGNETQELKPWQIGIANTLAGYAAQGWTKKPSEKQAKHGVAILEAYARAHPGE